MRFKINLERTGPGRFLPINYQYELSSAIYKVIDRADSAFSEFLHTQGYMAGGRQYRLFTFSRLAFAGYRLVANAGRLEHYGTRACFEIGFLIDRAAEEFIRGLFLHQHLSVGDKVTQVDYVVVGIEAMALPVFRPTMVYRCLSPMFVRRKRPDGGEDYLAPTDDGYAGIILQNLLSKTEAMVHAQAGHGVLAEEQPHFHLAPMGKVYKNGVAIKQHTAQASKLIGYMYEFELTCPTELHEIGYYAGFGHLNSQGFGCVAVKGGEG